MMTENKARMLVGKAYSLKQKIDSLTAEYNKAREALYSFMDQEKLDSFEGFELDDTGLTTSRLIAQKTERVYSLKYNAELLKKKIDKELYNEVTDKTYLVNDIDCLKTAMRKAGIKPSVLKQAVTVIETVNNAKIQQAYSVGDIKLSDISGTYDMKISKSVNVRKVSEKNEKKKTV